MKKTVAILSNHHAWTYNLRAEIIEKLIDNGYRVVVLVGYGNRVDDLIKMGCEFVDVPVDRHSKNPIGELKLMYLYFKVLRNINPDVVLSYTIKPNLYGAVVCRMLNIPIITNITGLGTAVEYPGLMRTLLISVYKLVFKKVHLVFFQNEANKQLFLDKKIVKDNYDLLPGSGVNIDKFKYLEYPQTKDVEFIFISRVMKEKGAEEFLNAAIEIKRRYMDVKFHICGFCEQAYEEWLQSLHNSGIINYHGMVNNVFDYLRISHCSVLPTYYPEGMSNVLLESCASGRPIITTDRPGCGEIVDDGINGFIVKAKDTEDLVDKMECFIRLSHEQKKEMGLAARQKVERCFNRNVVVDKYLNVINSICGK